jgi:head-tail adaptor
VLEREIKKEERGFGLGRQKRRSEQKLKNRVEYDKCDRIWAAIERAESQKHLRCPEEDTSSRSAQ